MDMIRLKIKSLYNNVHFIVIPLILIPLCFKYKIFYLFIIIYLIYIIRNKIFTKIIIVSCIITFSIFFYLLNKPVPKLENRVEGKVVDIQNKEFNTHIIIKTNSHKVLVTTLHFEYKVGDIILAEGNAYYPEEESYKGGFNYKEYLNSKGIQYIINATRFEFVKDSFCKEEIKFKIYDFYEKKLNQISFSYFKVFLFGDNDFNSTIKKDINKVGIAHIFSISGMHLNIIVSVLYLILRKFSRDEILIENILIIFLVIYVCICGFSVSIVRASSMIILGYLFARYSIRFSKIDILFTSIIINLLINPLGIYQVGFWLTYLISYFLSLFGKLTYNKNKLISQIKLSILCIFISLGITLNISNEVNLISIILVPIVTLIITYVLLPYTYMFLFIPIISRINLLTYFNKLITTIGKNSIVFKFKDLNIYFIIIYYILVIYIFILIESKKIRFKHMSIYIFFIFICYNIRLTNMYHEITIIDVGNGDSILVSLPHNKGNMLIDSYGSNLNYLKDMGIRKIDYLVLTHSDEDHIGSVSELIESINVKTIISSKYDTLPFNSKKVSSGDSFYLGDTRIDVLGPIRNSTVKNNISIVLQMNMLGYKFLFCGDIESQAELDLVNKYHSDLQSDFIKVAHHGSNTSSTSDFLSYVKPKYSFISVGLNNRYSFPSNEVLYRLSKTEIYQTSICKNIKIKISNKKLKILPYKRIN